VGDHTIVTHYDIERAHRLWVRLSMESLTPHDLLAELNERDRRLRLLLADKAARDFRRLPEDVLDNAIAYEAQRLEEAIIQLERLNRAQRLTNLTGIDAATAFAPRWEAVRRLDLIDALQSLGVPLVRRRNEWWACCPLHEEKTPSFSANQEKQVWHCFSCGKGGDLIDFIVHRQHVSKVEALRFAEAFLMGGMAA
jgi:hypothetical protein